MYYEVTSNSIGTSAEITAIMPIHQGTVDQLRTVTYATRLRSLLYTFNGLRKTAFESRPARAFAGATEAIQTLNSVRWMIFDQDTRLMLTVNFDSPWEPYIRRIVDVAGPILDAILCHCVNYELYSTDLGYERFALWVRNHQEDCEFFYSATPDLTVEDLYYLRALELYQRSLPPTEFDQLAAGLRAPSPRQLAEETVNRSPDAEIEQGLRALAAFHRLEKSFRNTGNGKHAWFLWRAAQRALADFKFLQRVPPEFRNRYEQAIEWAISEPTHDGNRPVSRPPPIVPIDEIRKDLQADVLTSYMPMTHGCLVLMRYKSPQAAGSFVEDLQLAGDGEYTTVADPLPQTVQTAQTISFTYAGLRRAGVPKDTLARMPKEFREGMESRAGYLGDMGPNHPDQWQLPQQLLGYDDDGRPVLGEQIRLSSVDMVVSVQTRSAQSQEGDHLWSTAHPLYQHVAEKLGNHEGVQILAIQPLRRPLLGPDEKVQGHFGLTDGISQPKPTLDPQDLSHEDPPGDEVSLGELLLGHKNAKEDPVSEAPGDLLYNGTFMAVRKLEQNVAAFDAFIAKAQQESKLSADLITAKMVGRWPDGRPLYPEGLCSGENDFDYSGDPNGEICPLHSHIRRANPRVRDSSFESPRIVRRGFMYGSLDPSVEDERGLVFMALNANIAEQFEIVQRWCAQGNSTSVFSGQADPLLGVARVARPRTLRFLDGKKIHRFDMNMKFAEGEAEQFVTLRWGLYTFVPSMSAVVQIAGFLNQPHVGADINELDLAIGRQNTGSPADYGRRVMSVLPDSAKIWKVALEDASARGAGITEGIWAEIEASGGARRTPFGVLVAKRELVEEVLMNQANNYSVRMYWKRLRDAQVGDGYIGMDPVPVEQTGAEGDDATLDDQYRCAVSAGRYESEATKFNDTIFAADEAPAFAAALNSANSFFETERAKQDVGDEIDISMESLVDHVLADLSSKWFGIPQKADDQKAVLQFSALAGFVFNPHPTDFVRSEGIKGGEALREAGERYCDAQEAGTSDPMIAGELFRSTLNDPDDGIENRDDFVRTLVGVAQGFSGPTRSTFLSVIATLNQTEELWRLQTELLAQLSGVAEASYETAQNSIFKTLQAAMRLRPVPEIVYRKAVRDCKIGDVDVQAGDLVTVSLKRASSEEFYMLFGGDYASSKKPVHACPGRRLAVGTLLGLICAILMLGTLLPAPSPLVVRVAKRSISE